MTKFILTSPTGNLGSRVLSSLLSLNLISPQDLILTTSSLPPSSSNPPRIPLAVEHNIPVRYGVDFKKSPSEITPGFEGGDVLVLSSFPSPSVERWEFHRNTIDAAVLAGVTCVVYTSLMFVGESGKESTAGVMQAHLRTINYLEEVRSKVRAEREAAEGDEGSGGGDRQGDAEKGNGNGGDKDFDFIVLREGIYAESWWLYCGFQPKILTPSAVPDGVMEWVIPNDGAIAWVSWEELGEGTAVILSQYQKYLGRSLRLTGLRATTLREIAEMVEQETGWEVRAREVGMEEAKRYHAERKSAGEGGEWVVESWSGWFEGLGGGECAVVDPFLANILGREVRGLHEMKGDLFKVQREQ